MNINEFFDLQGRTALITGGSGVLGRVMTSGLAQAVASELRAAGGEAIGVAADILDRAALERANKTITATLGPVGILINGAGGNQPQATTGAERTFFDLEMLAIPISCRILQLSLSSLAMRGLGIERPGAWDKHAWFSKNHHTKCFCERFRRIDSERSICVVPEVFLKKDLLRDFIKREDLQDYSESISQGAI